MSVLEACWILQPESEHSVEADVSDPDKRERERERERERKKIARRFASNDQAANAIGPR